MKLKVLGVMWAPPHHIFKVIIPYSKNITGGAPQNQRNLLEIPSPVQRVIRILNFDACQTPLLGCKGFLITH